MQTSITLLAVVSMMVVRVLGGMTLGGLEMEMQRGFLRPRATGTNLQTFTGALGGAAADPVCPPSSPPPFPHIPYPHSLSASSSPLALCQRLYPARANA